MIDLQFFNSHKHLFYLIGFIIRSVPSINMELVPNQIIAVTASPARIRPQNAFFYQGSQLTLGCGSADMGYAGVLAIR